MSYGCGPLLGGGARIIDLKERELLCAYLIMGWVKQKIRYSFVRPIRPGPITGADFSARAEVPDPTRGRIGLGGVMLNMTFCV